MGQAPTVQRSFEAAFDSIGIDSKFKDAQSGRTTLKGVLLMIRRFLSALIFALVSVLPLKVHALQNFDRVQCGIDIPKVLIGRRMTNEGWHEKQYEAAIGLENLGGSIASADETLGINSWMICGKEYLVLEKND